MAGSYPYRSCGLRMERVPGGTLGLVRVLAALAGLGMLAHWLRERFVAARALT